MLQYTTQFFKQVFYNMTPIKLESSDGVIFEVDPQVARYSIFIRNLSEERMEEDKDKPMDIEMVNSEILAKVIEWATRHKNDPPFIEDGGNRANNSQLSPWDAEFLSADPGDLFELILAAEYLDIKSLLDATCNKVASMLKDKTVEEIRQAFGIKNDFTPLEELQIQKENEWCEQK